MAERCAAAATFREEVYFGRRGRGGDIVSWSGSWETTTTVAGGSVIIDDIIAAGCSCACGCGRSRSSTWSHEIRRNARCSSGGGGGGGGGGDGNRAKESRGQLGLHQTPWLSRRRK